ncbi:radical SAM protein [Anaerotruncus colihominis]|uniref:Radical SAM protein n=1 Tax=Anaerotruncus colihominis TaxID=169435 RepID=A0A3E3IEB5_9FIRM|nr:radical SAM protein [Anaerotruncus colihominis]RGE65425.1 radical SAM protein [Anaerotruncus colihominis]
MSNFYTHLGVLDQTWLDCREIVVYGLGVMALKSMESLRRDFEIPFIIDNDPKKAGTHYAGIPILTLEQAREKLPGKKIVIASTYGVSRAIAKTLDAIGFRETLDYCALDLFAAEWYWHNRREVHLVEVHTTITEQCTFNCKNCNMFMPYFESPRHLPVRELTDDFDLFFARVDWVSGFGLLGGEPFLHPELYEILTHLCGRYAGRIGEISIITNGTIVPDQRLLELMARHNVRVHISDYSKAVPYAEKQAQVVRALMDSGVDYRVNESLVWTDFGFPNHPWRLSKEQAAAHMQSCAPVFRGLNSGRLYFCHVVWAAQRCGLYEPAGADSLCLAAIDPSSDADRRALLEYSLGSMAGGSLSFCKFCGGCGSDNRNFVQPAIQAPRGVQMHIKEAGR